MIHGFAAFATDNTMHCASALCRPMEIIDLYSTLCRVPRLGLTTGLTARLTIPDHATGFFDHMRQISLSSQLGPSGLTSRCTAPYRIMKPVAAWIPLNNKYIKSEHNLGFASTSRTRFATGTCHRADNTPHNPWPGSNLSACNSIFTESVFTQSCGHPEERGFTKVAARTGHRADNTPHNPWPRGNVARSSGLRCVSIYSNIYKLCFHFHP